MPVAFKVIWLSLCCVQYAPPLREGELALLVEEIGHRIREKHYQYFTELFAILGLSELNNGDPVPLEVWIGLAQAIADVSGLKVSFQAATLQPVAGDQNQEKRGLYVYDTDCRLSGSG